MSGPYGDGYYKRTSLRRIAWFFTRRGSDDMPNKDQLMARAGFVLVMAAIVAAATYGAS